jgi:hypothetical protein
MYACFVFFHKVDETYEEDEYQPHQEQGHSNTKKKKVEVSYMKH